MPESCSSCNLCHINADDKARCQAYEVTRKINSETYEKSDRCPLWELSERETEMTDADDLGADYVRGTLDGGNACLDEITGTTI